MPPRVITVLGLLQTMALFFGVLCTAVFRKFSLGYIEWEPRFAQSAAFTISTRFSHYGLLLGVLILAWVAWATYYNSDGYKPTYPASVVVGVGILLLIALIHIGIRCTALAGLPIFYPGI